MTLDQAVALNTKFTDMRAEMDSLKSNWLGMRNVADSMATDIFRLNYMVKHMAYKEQVTAVMYFSFWTAFVSYLQWFK